MRKVRALLVSAAVATGVLLSMTAAPAQAESIRYVYYLQSDCYNGGSLGIQWGWWTSFRCSYENDRWYLYA
ncbi:hypothetical protein GCM10010149_28080 [Nonomuraea roseoviolacea subsp. roseoviolacea]|uniref:Uncharacterized protein n=1 Tax=Nonomuraea roseoviolacea subsp. carminata TaxID=160689 RepID=A0ABT1JRN4_9ACTN|nr:hypothetical protein [Nonomuraea roseoviolacea]MCP2344097.1 hypothetical protein [Nonomuraea roseoviolacea subsp. carminata]